MPKSKHPKGKSASFTSQRESEDYFQRHQHEHIQRTLQDIRNLNQSMAQKNQPGPAPEIKSPHSEKRFLQAREVVANKDIDVTEY